jgi:ribosomal protein S2
MSAAKGVLSLQEEDLTKILVAGAHLGAQNMNYQMEQYVFKRRQNGKVKSPKLNKKKKHLKYLTNLF